MAELDIRGNGVTEIDTIRFSNSDFLQYSGRGDECFCISDGCECTNIFLTDIPNLIKALQKAQELWSASE